MRRSLIHFWPIHLAVVAGAAVATAVLTGSLVVGDSIQASLRDLTLERLGRVERAVTGERLFAAELAERLARASGAPAVPILALRGVIGVSCCRRSATGSRRVRAQARPVAVA